MVDEIVIDEQKNENESELNQTISGDGIYYKSGQVAKLLGITTDSLRYYVNTFSEFLNTEKTKNEKGGHLRFTDGDIEILQTIFTLLKNHTPSETKAILRNPDGVHIILSDPDAPGAQLLQEQLLNNELLVTRITSIMTELLSKALNEQSTLLLNKYALEDKQHNEEIEELQKQNELLAEQNRLLKEDLVQVKEQLTKIEEQKKSPKGFLGLFKK